VRLADRIHLVGSGSMGFDLTDPYDCHIFLLDGGDELALVDAGSGMGAEAVLENVRADGFDPARIRQLVLTHAHVDHAGGAARFRELLGEPSVLCSAAIAGFVRHADERGVSLDVARKAGFYPDDYVLAPCPVDGELAGGDSIRVGDLSLSVLDTPGHADGHLSLLLDRDGERILFGGDVVFFGGTILLQNTWDCRLPEHIRSLRLLRELEVTGLLPSHLTLSLRNGKRHIERANEALDRLLVPNQMVSAW
jgi:glyoxylase-like metal-dependent hydrolase (beta-lactamase superfamily II)